jgi:hypothetical protein
MYKSAVIGFLLLFFTSSFALAQDKDSDKRQPFDEKYPYLICYKDDQYLCGDDGLYIQCSADFLNTMPATAYINLADREYCFNGKISTGEPACLNKLSMDADEESEHFFDPDEGGAGEIFYKDTNPESPASIVIHKKMDSPFAQYIMTEKVSNNLGNNGIFINTGTCKSVSKEDLYQ